MSDLDLDIDRDSSYKRVMQKSCDRFILDLVSASMCSYDSERAWQGYKRAASQRSETTPEKRGEHPPSNPSYYDVLSRQPLN